MAQRSSIPELRHRIDERFDAAQPRQHEVPAILGNGQGTDLEHVRIDNTHSFARIGNTLMEVYNKRVPHIAETAVILGYHPDDPGLFQVLRVRETYLDRGYPMTPEHGISHGWFPDSGGHDPTYTDIRQWTPLRVYPVGGNLSVKISQMPKIWRGAWLTVDEQTLDLTAHLPAEGARYVLITIDADGVMMATAGTAVGDIFALQDSDIPTPPAGHFPLAAVRMYDTQTEIVEQRDNTDIVDLRFPPYAAMAPASGTGGVAWENVIVVAASGGDYTTIQAAVNAAISGQVVWVAPGTYAENVTGKAGVGVRGIGRVGDAIIAPSAGIPVTAPASGNVAFERFTLNPPAGQVALSIPAASTVALVLREMWLQSDGAASLDASTADATATLEIWNNTLLDGALNIKCVTTLYGVQIGGNVTQSAGAGNLAIYGGRIVGNLTTVVGSTISLHDLPTILGTVSGAGTIIGAYLNSSGHIVFVNGTAISGRANPSASVGLAAVNGTATTVMASDSAPALSQSIAPTWSGQHQWSLSLFAPDGSNAVPAYSFTNDQDSGIYLSGSNEVSVALGGVKKISFVAGVNAASLSFLGVEAIQYSSSSLTLRYGISSSVGAHQWGVGVVPNVMELTAGEDLNLVTGDLQLNGTTRISNAGAATFTNVTDSALTSGRVVLAGAAGLLADDADLTFNGTDLILGSTSGKLGIRTTPTATLDVYDEESTLDVALFTKGNDAATTGAAILLRRKRLAASVVQSGDRIGQVTFRGHDGTDYVNAAQVRVESDGTPGTNDMPGRILLMTSPDGSATLAERMRIDNQGNVIVNTAAIATGATDGFLYVPSCAGTPTGTPTTYTGRVPIIVDTTNNRFYFFSGGSWRNAGP